MNKFLRKILSVCLAVVLFSSFSGLLSCKKKAVKTVITVGVTAKNFDAMNAFIEAFNAKSNSAFAEAVVYNTEDEKNYYLSHGKADCDVYTFDYAVSANRYASELCSLDRNSFVNKYLVSIVNSMRAEDGHLYSIPSAGYYYTQCYNANKLAERGLEVPNTFSDLKLLASRLKYSLADREASSASIGGSESVIFSFMSVAYPLFLSTVRGAHALKGLTEGTLSISDPEYYADWQDVFVNLQVLYTENFYTISDMEKTADEGVARFNAGNAYAMQNTVNNGGATDIYETDGVRYMPFVGEEERSACFGARPAFYISASKRVQQEDALLAASIEFFDYFSTDEGQKILQAEIGGEEFVSFFKGATYELSSAYSGLQGKVDEGRLFLIGSFYSTFTPCVNEIAAFLSNEINLEKLFTEVDAKLKEERASIESSITVVEEELGFDEKTSYSQDTPLGEFLVSTLAEANFVDCAIVPSSMINCALLKGSLTESQLNCVFKNEPLVYARLTAEEFVAIYKEINKDCHPLLSKVRVEGDTLKKENGAPYLASDKIYALIPVEYTRLLSDGDALGKQVSSNAVIAEYLKKNFRR